ncbi:MAG: signal peptidase I [Clostridiales bacterium]|nr:signal peptidase I [Clostridiales bacterium]
MTGQYWSTVSIPSIEEVEHERERLRRRKRRSAATRTVIYVLIVLVAVIILIAAIVLPVIKVTGTSMEPTLEDGDVVVLVKGRGIDAGDIVALYYNNRLLLKRVIGMPGDVIEISDDGIVTRNGEPLDEPYVQTPSLGECDMVFPYEVPQGSYFVMGDNREFSVDSRSRAVGSIAEDQIVGKVIFRIWPLGRLGAVS